MIKIARISNLNHDIDVEPHSHNEPHKKRMRELGEEQRMMEPVDEQRMMEPVDKQGIHQENALCP